MFKENKTMVPRLETKKKILKKKLLHQDIALKKRDPGIHL